MLTSYVNKNDIPAAPIAPELFMLKDKERSFYVATPDGVEPLSGTIQKWCVGDGVTTTFTIGTIPANSVVDMVNIVVSGTAGTSTTTVAVGVAGTIAKYQAASAFTNSMNVAGAKANTTIKGYETAAISAIATFSTAWDSGALCLVTIHYTKLLPVGS
jgi:hypothetical protein